MTIGVEEFIIKLGFDDKEALAGYKSFIKQVDDLNKKVVSSINNTRQQISKAKIAQNNAELTTNRILTQQIKLRDQIINGKQLGLDTSKEEKTLSLAKKYETLRQRTLDIEERISKERLKQASSGLKEDNFKVDEKFIKNEANKIKKLLDVNIKLGVDKSKLESILKTSKYAIPVMLKLPTIKDTKEGVITLLSKVGKPKVNVGVKFDKSTLNDLEVLKLKLQNIQSIASSDLKLRVDFPKVNDVKGLFDTVTVKSEVEEPKPSSKAKDDKEQRRKLKNSFRDTITQAVKLKIDTSTFEKQLDNLVDAESIKKANLELKTLISQVKYLDAQHAKVKVDVESPIKAPVKPSEDTFDEEYTKILRQRNILTDTLTRAIKLDIDVTPYRKLLDTLTDSKEISKTTQEVRKLISELNHLEATNKKLGKADLSDDDAYNAMVAAHVENQALDQKRLEEANQREYDRYQNWFSTQEKERAKEEKDAKAHRKLVEKNTKDTIKSAEEIRKAKIKEAKEVAYIQEKLHKETMDRQDAYQRKVDRANNTARFRNFERFFPEEASNIRRQRQEFVDRTGNVSASPSDIKAFARQQIEMEAAITDATKSVNRQARAMLGLHTVQLGLRDSTRHLIRSYASMFALFAGTAAINRVGQDFESIRASMLLSAGGAKEAAADFKFVQDNAVKMGLDLKEAADGFVKLKFAASGKLSNTEIEDLFVGYNEFAKAIGVDKFRVEKGMVALQQMMNKGQVMAEELKNQLAENVPGSLKVFEDALGVGSDELFRMMERGELLAEDVLPKVGASFAKIARQGGALEAQLKSGRTTQQQFTTALQMAGDTVYKSGFEEGMSGMFTTLVDELQDGRKALEGLGKVYKWFFDTISLGIKIIAPALDSTLFVLGEIASIFNNISNFLGNNFISSLVLVGGGLLGLTKVLKGFPKLLKFLPFFSKGLSELTEAEVKTTKSTKLLGKAFMAALRSPLIIVTAIVAVLDELFSLFTKGRVGLIEAFLIGEDVAWMDDIMAWFDKIKNMSFGELTAELGNAIVSGAANSIKGVITNFTTLTGKIVEIFAKVDWGAVISNIGIGLTQGLMNVFFGFFNFWLGAIEAMINEIPMVDVEITDSISEKMEEWNKSLSASYKGVMFNPPKVEDPTKTEDTSSTAPIINNNTQSPVQSNSNISNTYNTPSNTQTNSSSNTNNVTNNVTVEVSANNFGEQGRIADEIAAKVEQALNKSYSDAALNNGS